MNNEIYTHDLDSYAVGEHNCLSVPFDHLLSHGFNTRQTDVRPANSLNTAMQLVAVIFQLQSLQQFGGVSATHLDWTMVPYVRKSFYKHFQNGVRYLYGEDFHAYLGDIAELPIESPWYNSHPKASEYALDMTEKECHQAVEALYHNLNTLQSRSGNQLPFTSINYGTCTLPEGRMIIKELLTVSIDGLGKLHRTSIFPCGIFQCMKGVNRAPGDPNYDMFRLALRSTAQRLYPNYANCDVSMQMDWVKYDRDHKQDTIDGLSVDERGKLIRRLEESPELKDVLMLDVVEEFGQKTLAIRQEQLPIEIMSTMGCRTQNGADINAVDSYWKNVHMVIEDGKLYDDFISCAQKDGRGNICPATIILPTLAMEAKEYTAQHNAGGDLEEQAVYNFMALLDKKLYEAKDIMLERFNWICSQSPESAKFMYENNLMSGYVEEEGIRSALRHGTLALGMLGMAEALQILIGCNQTKPEGMVLAKEICALYKKRCAEFKEQYKLNYGVYYTPAENLCYTAMTKFREKYGIIPNVSENDYFTNSIHVPVWEQVNIFEKIDIESQLTGYSSAGCITYVELDTGAKNNLDALETIVSYAMDKDIPYFAINVPNDMCQNCGYTDEIGNACPMCGCCEIRRLRRVTGLSCRKCPSTIVKP